LHAANESPPALPFGEEFDLTFKQRIREADEFYNAVLPARVSKPEKSIARAAYAGLLWSKQFYHYIIKDWLEGDPEMPPPPKERLSGRNHDWTNIFCRDVISMPDKWEYPWFAAWDLAFHCVCFAHVDPQFAKEQLILLMREWYMHPNGHLPAYEYSFSDVNPPVHAWAVWRVYKMTGRRGHRDLEFLERAFHKLMLNFTWWVNRKDPSGRNIFSGGFLGMDNVGVFDRNVELADGAQLSQADGTAWMAFFCGTMLSMALELAAHKRVYEDVASKFFEHFVAIVDAMNTLGGTGLWDDADGFYYDRIESNGKCRPLKLRSMVGLVPLLACEVLEHEQIDALPGFKKRMDWFTKHRGDLARHISWVERDGLPGRCLLAVPSREKLARVLRVMLDEKEFLSPFGVRSMSAVHRDKPVVFRIDGKQFEAHYAPGESDTELFGGNSNWRGPSGSRSTTCSSRRWKSTTITTAKIFKSRCRARRRARGEPQRGRARLSRRLVSLFVPEPKSGHRPCEGENRTAVAGYRAFPRIFPRRYG
jgi:hypothetical protein